MLLQNYRFYNNKRYNVNKLAHIYFYAFPLSFWIFYFIFSLFYFLWYCSVLETLVLCQEFLCCGSSGDCSWGRMVSETLHCHPASPSCWKIRKIHLCGCSDYIFAWDLGSFRVGKCNRLRTLHNTRTFQSNTDGSSISCIRVSLFL